MGDDRYDVYEQTLLRRDNLRKEAVHWRLEYVRVFGARITEAFELKIDCVRKKKMVRYCQRQVNLGRPIDWDRMEDAVEAEMTSYEEELARLIEERKAALGGTPVSAGDFDRIKKIYYRLAKKIHPDLHPFLAEDETIGEYWQQISDAYRANDLEALEELEFLVLRYLEEIGYAGEEETPDLPDLEERIAEAEREIERILETEPYLYRLVLEDEASRRDKAAELDEEIESYRKYAAELDAALAAFGRRERKLS